MLQSNRSKEKCQQYRPGCSFVLQSPRCCCVASASLFWCRPPSTRATFCRRNGTYKKFLLRDILHRHLWDPILPARGQSMDWFDKERWLATVSQLNCFYVENICHGARQYFYDKSFGGKDVQQPRWKIDRSTNAKQKYFYNSPGHSISIGVEEMAGQEQSCFYSPIENHIVLHGSHNGMLGEFYARVLPGLKHMMETLAPGEDQRRWQEGTQLYLDAWKSLPYFHYGQPT